MYPDLLYPPPGWDPKVKQQSPPCPYPTHIIGSPRSLEQFNFPRKCTIVLDSLNLQFIVELEILSLKKSISENENSHGKVLHKSPRKKDKGKQKVENETMHKNKNCLKPVPGLWTRVNPIKQFVMLS